ncbi:MAG: hypothetical protein AABZ14_05095 [Candidatus Margulisiibacteriota bacterium]
MISSVSRYGFSPMSLWSSARMNNVGQEASVNTGNFAPIRPRTHSTDYGATRGPVIHLYDVPASMQWIASEIMRAFKIKVKNSDNLFSEEELEDIYLTLKSIPPEHLSGVTMIVKNKGLQLNMETVPAGMFTKMHKNRVYGAYDKSNKRIYIFDLEKREQLAAVLKHEIGHAVHSYNLSFEEFYAFMLRSGWNVVRHERQLIEENQLYNIGMRKIPLSKEEALKVMAHFDWESVHQNKSRFNEFMLDCPEDRRGDYIYKNPYETFASCYEKIF